MAKKKQELKFKWADRDASSCKVDTKTTQVIPDIDSFFDTDESLKKDSIKTKTKQKKKKKKKQKTKDSKTPSNMMEIAAKATTSQKRKYRIKKKKFKSIDDIISYMNDHYLEIDNIAETLLEDSTFFGFLKKKNAHQYEESLALLNVLKEKIEKK
ncbi:MAG: hypothetical protein UMR38_02530 [Candidatus Izemoplasma sp.]|nr:hypothetical protein [Candidatus Izemoplasma sp.]